MTQTVKKLVKIAPEDKFKEVVQYLLRTFKVEDPEQFMFLVLTMLTLPQQINTYRFLVNIDKHQIQQIYEDKNRLSAQEKTNSILSDFYNKIKIWAELEQSHEFQKDQAKTQQKYTEIYESLKKYFNQEPDEKQERVK